MISISKKKKTTIIEQVEFAPNSYEVRKYDDVKDIANEMLNKKLGVTVDISRLDEDYKRRVMDFLNGVIYALKGNVEKVSSNVYRFTLKN
jgi:cell division inhibitor SepF